MRAFLAAFVTLVVGFLPQMINSCPLPQHEENFVSKEEAAEEILHELGLRIAEGERILSMSSTVIMIPLLYFNKVDFNLDF